MSRTASRRLLATLANSSASAGSSSSSSQATPLLPPYAHALAAAEGAAPLRPPYSHRLSPEQASRAKSSPSRIGAQYQFKLHDAAGPSRLPKIEQIWLKWASELIGSEAGREEVVRVWKETLEGLEAAVNRQDRAVLEISYSELALYLSNPEAISAIRDSGSIVIRDVIPDSLALGWAGALFDSIKTYNGQVLFWHPALLAARSNASLLAATSTVLNSVAGTEPDESFIFAEAAQAGLGSVTDGLRVGEISNAWGYSTTVAPATPLVSHLALTNASDSISLPSTVLASTYSLLRRFFRPKQSKISLGSESAYLASSNWTLNNPEQFIAAVRHASSASPDALPHLRHLTKTSNTGASIKMNPGDVLVRNSGNPTFGGAGQAFLPISLLPRTSANVEYAMEQRRAYEAGLPPPSHAIGGSDVAGVETVRIEESRGESGISGWKGKRVMGY